MEILKFNSLVLKNFSHIKEECLRINQPTNNVIELYIGTLSHENNCHHLHNNNYNLYLTFFTKSFTIMNSCSNYINQLLVQSNIDFYSEQKLIYMSIDCDSEQKLINLGNEKGLKLLLILILKFFQIIIAAKAKCCIIPFLKSNRHYIFMHLLLIVSVVLEDVI